MKKCVFTVLLFTCFLLVFSSLFFTFAKFFPFSSIKHRVQDAGNTVNAFFKSKELQQEIESLNSEIIKLKAEKTEYEKLKKENENLRNLLKLSPKTKGKHSVFASVTGINTDGDFFLTADRGENDGVSVNDAVVFGRAVVGKVARTYSDFSVITPITSINQETGAKTTDGSIGILTGSAALFKKNLCFLSFLGDEAKVNKGDTITTSSFSEIYPEEYILGTVESVDEKITVKTEVDFFKLSTVCIQISR